MFTTPDLFRSVRLISTLSVVLSTFTAECADSRTEFFERRIRPLLIEKCVACHGSKKQEGNLRLDSRVQVIVGTSELDALVVAKKPEASRLFQVLQHTDDDVQMPPKQKLKPHEIAAVRQWIIEGAAWPDDSTFGDAAAVDKDAWKQHWAFQPIADPPRPPIGTPNWHPIDAFVRFTLRERKLHPSALADGATLVRRVSYAVTGLPPEPSDVQAARTLSADQVFPFVSEYTDRLLATPQFGERWARYWLDVSRYADTKGYVFTADREYKEAWKFREWVIRSLNDDLPYDEFLKRQIAADQLPGKDDPNQLAAMGFFTLGRRFLNNKHDVIDDRIDVLTRGTMALTVTCARCHDHKFDPIPTTDYYSLYGVFDSSQEPGDAPSALRLVDLPKPREPVVFVRGLPGNRGDRVRRRFLTALSSGEPKPYTNGSGRLELAQQIASADNPLTARVAVNRIWLRLFGKGLVDSPSDFGVRTPPPSHPALLDHLATWFIRNGWSRKKLIRYIMLSYAWRQSSDPRPDAAVVDPENRLLARAPRRRLDFEAYRDSVLSVASNLAQTVGGESADITSRPFTNRRTVYARIDRQNLPGLFRTFDFASPDSHAAKRFETTVPQQGLFQFNSPFMLEQATLAAEKAYTADSNRHIDSLYKRILKRQPTTEETLFAQQFVAETTAISPNGKVGAGWHFGYGELDANKSDVVSFQHLPAFKDGRWGGNKKMPDAKLGWCSVTKDGGHPGHNLQLCSIRRWVADRDCTVQIFGRLKHPEKKGDGIHGHIVYSKRSLATEKAFHSTAALNTQPVDIKAGDAIDFVVDCNGTDSFDSFEWHIRLQQSVDGRTVRTWQSNREFAPRQPQQRLSPMAQLAQTLMMTNEFVFVD